MSPFTVLSLIEIALYKQLPFSTVTTGTILGITLLGINGFATSPVSNDLYKVRQRVSLLMFET